MTLLSVGCVCCFVGLMDGWMDDTIMVCCVQSVIDSGGTLPKRSN
jgi:hypothetical protein